LAPISQPALHISSSGLESSEGRNERWMLRHDEMIEMGGEENEMCQMRKRDICRNLDS